MSPPSQVRRGQGDDGFAGGFEGLLFGVLLFVVGTLLIGYAWGVVDTKAATEQAARQAVRTYVEAPDASAAADDARQAADSALSGYGRNPAGAAMDLVSGSFARCARVTIAVTYPAPLVELPVLGRLGQAQKVRSQHSELVDPFRSGLGGSSGCP
jgi:hypothetical protein